MIDQKVNACSKLKVWYYIEKDQPQSDYEITGTLSVNSALDYLTSPLKNEYYLSGPPGMLKTIKSDLPAYNVPSERIKIDTWE